jgi:AhpD family alkylhydroperoxidase
MRIAYHQLAPDAIKAMLSLEKYLHHSSIEPMLMHLVKLRASQINGCAYCVDMHSKDLLANGETMQRIYGLNGWAETSYYTDRERAALEWTEVVNAIGETHASDAQYEEARKHFSEQELVDLTWIIATINAWNRVAIAFRADAGSYQPPKLAAKQTVV